MHRSRGVLPGLADGAVIPLLGALHGRIGVAAPLAAAVLEVGEVVPGVAVGLAEACQVDIVRGLPRGRVDALLGVVGSEVAPFGAVQDAVGVPQAAQMGGAEEGTRDQGRAIVPGDEGEEEDGEEKEDPRILS